MNILLVIPPYRLHKSQGVKPWKAMLPTGPGSIVSLLKQVGCNVRTINTVFKKRWWKKLKNAPMPDVLLLPAHTQNVIPSCIEVQKVLYKFWDRLPYTVTSCGLLTRDQLASLGFNVNMAVIGYGHGEEVVHAILNRIAGDIKLDNPPPILPLPNFADLDKLTLRHYRHHSGETYPLVREKGCKFSCGYCGVPGKGQRSERDFQNMHAELLLAKRMKYREIWDVSNLNFVRWQDPKEWAKVIEFDSLVFSLGLTWRCMTRLELVPPSDHLTQLKALTNVAIALETMNEFEWKLWKRGGGSNYLQNFRRAVSRLKEAGIPVTVFVMLDTPLATISNTWDMFHFLEECQISDASASYYGDPEMVTNGHCKPSRFGFYFEPYGNSALTFAQAVGFMMIFHARWQLGWHPLPEPFFQCDGYGRLKGKVIGVQFQEGCVFQRLKARAKTGDGWRVWRIKGGDFHA